MPTGQYERPHQRITAELRDKITGGRWQVGDRLPPMAQLQAEYGVAKGTIQRALRQLEADGLVVGKAGSGIYVQRVELST
ncbi:winged helix-turn-helix domain-containing protein [Pseudonocardia nematodicida]|uniref:Winged helix-turn-helix domain-containing protein n=1 Tax=Pseudonocardia nematodicida TaxID=1206997 RepID=A0ABV1K9L3_9PSEU